MRLTEEFITQIQEAFQKLDPDKEYEIEVDEMEVGDEKVTICFTSPASLLQGTRGCQFDDVN